jgi:cytochrome b561
MVKKNLVDHADENRLSAKDLPNRYDALSRSLHLIFAVIIIYASVSGYSLIFIHDQGLHDFLAQLNVSLTTVLIILFPLRYGWKFFRTNPAPLHNSRPRQLAIVRFVHNLLYLNIALVLITGYLMVPDSYKFFGLVTIPTPFNQGSITDFFFMVHRICCLSLSGLVVLHLAGVIRHRMLYRDNLLRRMF